MAIENRDGQWYFRFQYNGVEHRRPTGLDAVASNETEARDMEAEYRRLLKLGKAPGSVRRIRFSQAAEEFLKWCETTEYRGRESTYKAIKTSFASLKEFFGEVDVCAITDVHVEDYKRWRSEVHQVRPCTLHNNLCNLSLFFNKWAMKRKLAESNPTEEVTIPSTKDEIRIHVLTEQEEKAYFKAALKKSKSLYDLGRIMILQGPRPEEVLAFRKEHFDRKHRTQFIPGGKTTAARRSLDLTDEAYEILLWRSRQNPESPWMFPSPRIEGAHLTKLNDQHDDACREAGVSFCIYDLRHTFGTRMAVDVGVPLPALQAIMGHSTLSMVMRYVHPNAEAKAAAMQKYQSWINERSDKSRTRKKLKTA